MMKYKHYEHKIAENEQVLNRMNDQLNSFKRDKEKLEHKNDQTDNRVKELENHLFMNNQEKEKLTNQLKTRSNDYDDLRGKYARL